MENLILTGGARVPNKEERAGIIFEVIQKVKDGEIDSLALWVKCIVIKKMAEEILKSEDLYSIASGELMKYPEAKGGLTIHGAKIEKVPDRKYDYSADPKWAELEKKIETASAGLIAEQKQREEYLKKIPMGTSLFDETTGEVLATSAIKKDGEMLKVTLK